MLVIIQLASTQPPWLSNLQRHFPIELRILGQIHLAHAAGTERGGDPVVFE